MAQLKNKQGQNVMPNTTAENVEYSSGVSVKQKIQQVEQAASGGGGGSPSGESCIEYTNLFDPADIKNNVCVIYSSSGRIGSKEGYGCVFIPLNYGEYYCLSGYNFFNNSGNKQIALGKGTKTDFTNLLGTDFVDGAAWLNEDSVFTHSTNIYRASCPDSVVFRCPTQEELADQTIQVGLVVNVIGKNGTATDTYVGSDMRVVNAMYPIEYSGIKGKNAIFFGDSITNSGSGYPEFVSLVKAKLGLNICHNYGSSGAATARLASIMLNNNFRGSTSGAIDYKKYQAVIIQIGTNGGVSGNIDNDIPDISINDISSYPYTYSASGKTISSATLEAPIDFFTECFANTFYGNIALCIEYVHYINPNCRVFLTTIPPNTGGYGSIGSVNAAIKNLAAKMGVQVIDAQANAGLGLWNMSYWCRDAASSSARTHFNAKGCEMWGSYIAHALEHEWFRTSLE